MSYVCAYGFPDEAVRSSGVAGDCEPPGVGPGSLSPLDEDNMLRNHGATSSIPQDPL